MPNAYNEYDYVVKVVVVGDSAVGKTSLLLRYADDTYDDKYLATIGVDFRISTLEIQNKVVKLQLWDTAGQERFRTITQNYYRGSNAVVVCFDLTDQETFQNCKRWMADVESYCPSDVTRLLVGTKADLKERRMVQYADAKAFGERYGCPYFETSAKTSEQVEAAFLRLVDDVIAGKEKKKHVEVTEKHTVRLQTAKTVSKERNCFGWLSSFFW